MRRTIELILAVAALALLCALLQPAAHAATSMDTKASTATTPAAPARCGPWDPGSAPYGGGPDAAAAAVERLPNLSADARRQLADQVRQRYGGQRVMVSASGISGGFANLRDMNGAGGHICHGPVDRSTWPAGRNESGWAYSYGSEAVLVLDSCGNVAQITNTAALPPPAAPSREALRRGASTSTLAYAVLPFAAPADATVHRVPEPVTGWLVGMALLAALVATRRNCRRHQP